MNLKGLKEDLTYFATLYLEDVAEKPERLTTAQKLITERIEDILEERGLLDE